MRGPLWRAYLLGRAYVSLVHIHQLLRQHSLMEVYRQVVRPWKLNSRELAVDDPLLADIEWAVARAAAWQWQRTVCLPRSLATYTLLQACGAQPRLIVGVTSQPFSSHAWVEIGGTPVGDLEMAGRHYQFRPILRLPQEIPTASC